MRFGIYLMLATVPAWSQTDAHLYSPGSNLERSEPAQLETATRTLDVAMYSFTDRELAEELAMLARKGVRVRVYPGAVHAGDAVGRGQYDQHPACGGR